MRAGRFPIAAAFLLMAANAFLASQEAATDPGPPEEPAADASSSSPEAEPLAPPEPEKQGLTVSGRSWTDIAAQGLFGEDYGNGDYGYVAAVAARLNFVNAKREVLKFEASLEAGFSYGSAAAALAPPGYTGNDYAAWGLSVKKLSLGLDLSPLSFVAGRQIFNSGRALVFSPADLFSSPDVSGLSAGRNGMDLARAGLALGPRSGIDLIAKPGMEAEHGDYSLRAHSGFSGFEAAVQGARRMGREEGQGSWIAAADAKADLVLGIYGEAALFMPDSGDPAVRATLGADYSFFHKLFLRAEYYYNGLSEQSSANASMSSVDPLSAFPGGQYLYAGLGWVPNEDLSANAFWLGELGAANGGGTASVSWQAAQNALLTAFLRSGYADPFSLQLGMRMEVKF